MTASKSTPSELESVTDEQDGEPAEKPIPPSEAKAELETADGHSLIRVEQDVTPDTVEVCGTADLDGEPNVSLTIKSTGLRDTSVVSGFEPETARELAEQLKAQADHAEQWAEYKRDRDE
mgnify:CR=1 FL=1